MVTQIEADVALATQFAVDDAMAAALYVGAGARTMNTLPVEQTRGSVQNG